MPIGNLTSQIFSNIYLNEFDRFVVHILKPRGYMRYGDDFIMFAPDEGVANAMREKAEIFLRQCLRLELHSKNNIIVRARQGIHFLGVDIFPNGRQLRSRMRRKISRTLSHKNLASYVSLVRTHEKPKSMRDILWRSVAFLEE